MAAGNSKTHEILSIAIFMLLIIFPTTTIPQEVTVERIRGFICDLSAMGQQADIAPVEGGDTEEAFFIRPVGTECYFQMFYRDENDVETQVSENPGGFNIAHAIVSNDMKRIICASDAIHTAVQSGEANEREVESVSIRCWAGITDKFGTGVTIVPGDPEYAAWVVSIKPNPEDASVYRVVWIRDFSFQFFNMSDAGRPATDGTYETSFTIKQQEIIVGPTIKLADTTMYNSQTTFESWEPTEEEQKKLLDL